MNLKINSTFLRFLIAGGFNTFFGWLIFSMLILMDVQTWIALILTNLVGIGVNFVTQGAYAFRNMSLNRFPSFIASYVAIYTVNLIGINAMRNWVENPIISQLILTLPLAILSFCLLSKFVFKPEVVNL